MKPHAHQSTRAEDDIRSALDPQHSHEDDESPEELAVHLVSGDPDNADESEESERAEIHEALAVDADVAQEVV